MANLLDVPRPMGDGPMDFIGAEEVANVDSEGRCIAALYKISPERAEFKYNFNAMLEHQARNLVAKGCHVIFAGDMNISHKRIDNCDPCEEFDLAPERMWLSRLLDRSNDIYFVDAFRHFHPLEKEQYTCWNLQKFARVTNFGTRIDYIICDAALLKYFVSCEIHPEIMGSDHCPVSAVLDINAISAEKLSKKCTRFWPEFAGTQTSLKGFFVKPYGDQDNSYDLKGSQHSLNSSTAHEGEEAETLSKSSQRKVQLNASWKNILKGPPQAPPCSGHGETSVMRVVKKEGPNKGRKFFCCARPEGAANNKEARCKFFVWT
ncbi:DNA-(apurinic or apyrimidinic site) lyase 2-like [Tropilaelaps mercedesae]|uniref:DNA-(apurinic or apyrimidinic site) endonuclease 2 n=1 Tax=Tropilaelaps mercedesae TaxID=418985 RepID=A0A1V9XZY9_9ACAR|nr:DNA-(apurinic or apyrimidinic site) lyase 2-like [Tropilaelaps mercedesae]